MPLTFAHPLAIIPFRRFRFPFSALVIGSLTPDFNYLFLTQYKMGHTLLGQFYFCLPVGLLTFLLYHSFVKKPLISLLPNSHSRVLSGIKKINYFSSEIFPYVIVGLLIGSFTHYLWDSFTHFYGFAVKELTFLQRSTPIWHIRFYKVLQHLSTLAGAIILVILYYKWYQSNRSISENESGKSDKLKYFIIGVILLIPVFLSLVKIFQYENDFLHFKSYRILIIFMMQTFLPPLAAMVLLYCISWNIFNYREFSFRRAK